MQLFGLVILLGSAMVGCAVPPAMAAAGRRSSSAASMYPNPIFDVGGLPFCAATADLDRDGRADLIVCSARENGRLCVLMGQRGGAFGSGNRIDTGWNVEWLVTGDFNNDGILDVVAIQDGRILMLPGNGDGSFSEPIASVLEGKILRAAAAADFNQDGHMDLAVPSLKSATVEILLGRGDGAFSRGSSASVGEGPMSVAAGDFDGDGRVDIATANVESHDLSVLLGRASGQFDGERRVHLEHQGYRSAGLLHSHSIVAGDLNRDGRDDLIVSHQDAGTITVLLGTSGGVLSPRGDYPVGGFPLPPAITDVNGDREMDIVLGNYASDDVWVFLGDGKGAFEPRRKSAVCEGPGAVAIGRFDVDSRPDIAVACRNSMAVSIFRGNGDGTFGPGIQQVHNRTGIPEASVDAITAGDFDHDRHADLALAVSFTDQILVMRDFESGAPRSQAKYQVGWNPTSIAVGRFNRDRHPDLAVAVRNWDPRTDGPTICVIGGIVEPPASPRGEIVVLLGRGDGTFDLSSRLSVGWRPADVKTADFNGDGLEDLVVANRGEPRIGEAGYLSMILAREDGSFDPERPLLEVAGLSSIAIADFNSDGHPDLAIATSDHEAWVPGTLAVHYGAGDGTLGDAVLLDSAWWGGCLAVGDLDGDGSPDLVAANAGTRGYGPYVAGETAVYLSRPNGTFAPGRAIQTGPPLCVSVGDIDGDHRPDVAALNWSHEISVLLGRGGLAYSPRNRFSAAGPAQRFTLADLDGDGREDLIAGVKGGISVLMNRRDSR